MSCVLNRTIDNIVLDHIGKHGLKSETGLTVKLNRCLNELNRVNKTVRCRAFISNKEAYLERKSIWTDLLLKLLSGLTCAECYANTKWPYRLLGYKQVDTISGSTLQVLKYNRKIYCRLYVQVYSKDSSELIMFRNMDIVQARTGEGLQYYYIDKQTYNQYIKDTP